MHRGSASSRDGFVELGVFSARYEFRLLAELSREVANVAGGALEKLADGDHPHRHGGALHFAVKRANCARSR